MNNYEIFSLVLLKGILKNSEEMCQLMLSIVNDKTGGLEGV